jgi:putative transposase
LAHHNTVFSQLLKFLPRHEFESLARQHHQGGALRKTSRWSQFVALALGQLTGRQSLRDIEANLTAQGNRLYHLGTRGIARSSLSRLNEQQPHSLFEALFARLYARCQSMSPKHKFRFNNRLYSVDSSLIDLSLSIFPWAHYALGKAAVKLHVGLDHAGHLPAFASITESRVSDIAIGRTLQFPRSSIVAFDKGYVDYRWFKQLDLRGILFVTRLKRNAAWRVVERREVVPGTGVSSDQTIELTGVTTQKLGLPRLRRVGYRDSESGQRYDFLTNNFRLSAKTIADIYKQRWQIELFFKWIKHCYWLT